MKRALFLDRDGVINIDRHYVCRREDFDFQDGIFDIARSAVQAGWLLVVVTNQSGIARGKYTEADFQTLTAWMRQRFAEEGAPVAKVYHCPCHPEFPHPELDAAFGSWRKPEPGMLLQASADLSVDLAASMMIGDQWTDAQAAVAAGVGRIAIVGEPKGNAPPEAARARRFASVAALAAIWPAAIAD